MGAFASAISAWARKVNEASKTVAKESIKEVCAPVVQESPVDTGEFRYNWQPSWDTPETGTLHYTDDDNLTARITGDDGARIYAPETTGASVEAIERLEDVVDNYDGEVFWFVNNLDYAEALEYEGWSGQTPAGGMVRATKAKWDRIVRKNQNKYGIK